MIGRRRFLGVVAVGLAAPFVLRGRARAQEFRLRLHHALPRDSTLHAGILAPWAAQVGEASGGRIGIEVVADVVAAGGAQQLAGQVRDGAVEMAWIPVASDARRFLRLEAFHLPFVASKRAVFTSQAVQDFAAAHPEEFADVRLLFAAAGSGAVIHANKPVAALADLKGMRLCPPTRLAGEALQALGAIAVTVDAPLVGEALAQKVLDGCLWPWAEAASAKLPERVGFHSEIPPSLTLSSSAYALVMNIASFDKLPEELRRVLMERSGQDGAALAGQAFDAVNAEATAVAQARGNKFVELAPEEKVRWAETARPVITAWEEAARSRGLDGRALVAEARALIAKYDPPPAPPASPPAQPGAPGAASVPGPGGAVPAGQPSALAPPPAPAAGQPPPGAQTPGVP